MSDPRQFRLRVTYRMRGRMAMLSHLEVTHALERMVRRAQLPFAITNGFSPHMKLSFGSALPVGVGGECEIFDVTLARYVNPNAALKALANAAPEGLQPIDCAYVEPTLPAASVAYPLSRYEIKFDRGLERFDYPATIEVLRKRKAKVLDVDDYLVGDVELSSGTLRLWLQSFETGALRIDKLLDAALSHMGSQAKVLSITRIAQEERQEAPKAGDVE